MNINELYSEYRRSRNEKILLELVKQSKWYCVHFYKKWKKTYWAVPREKGLEIAEEQALFCSNRCLKEEIKCYKRCLVAYFRWRMNDYLEKLIDDQILTYADNIKKELGLDESKISDDEAVSSAFAASSMEEEGVEKRELERWCDIENQLENLNSLEVEVFRLSFTYSAQQVADITGKSKNQVAKAKSSAKHKLMNALSNREE